MMQNTEISFKRMRNFPNVHRFAKLHAEVKAVFVGHYIETKNIGDFWTGP